MKRILVILFALAVLGALAAPALAVDPITVTSSTFTCNFRENLKFDLQAQSSAGKISQVTLYIAIDGVSSTARQAPTFTPDKQVQATYEWLLTDDYLPPGVTGLFWWTIEDDAGSKLTTDKQPFRVQDSSKQWKVLSNEQYALFWYNGSDAFGQALFDRGVQAIGYVQQDLGITVDKQVQAFIYGDSSSFRKALAVGSQEWLGGVSYSDYSIIMMHIEPSNLEWGKGATTHELTHQVIRQKIQSPLGSLSMPHWVNEGMAMYYETYPGTVDRQFNDPLNRAIAADTLPALRTLSGTFPADSDAADLAYAQSYAVVDFIYRQYGKDKMAALLQEFKKGGSNDEIFARVLGLSIDELDNEWRKSVGLAPRAISARAGGQPTPFPTYSLSSDESTPSPAAVTPIVLAATPAPTATPTPTRTSTPVPTATSTPSTLTSVILVDDYETKCQLKTMDDESHTSGCENGEYVMVNKKGGYVWRMPYPGTYGDAVVSVEGRVPNGDTGVEYGLAIRVSSEPQYYIFTVRPDGTYSFFHYSATTKWTALVDAAPSGAIKTGSDKNRLQVIMQGNQFALYVNDEFLDTVTDSKLTSGTVALVISSDNDNGKAVFDNVVISRINRPLTLPASKGKLPALPEIQAGMGGIIVDNYCGFDVNIDVGGKFEKVAPNGRAYIYLPPGHYAVSATAAGSRLSCGGGGCSLDVSEGKYTIYPYCGR